MKEVENRENTKEKSKGNEESDNGRNDKRHSSKNKVKIH